MLTLTALLWDQLKKVVGGFSWLYLASHQISPAGMKNIQQLHTLIWTVVEEMRFDRQQSEGFCSGTFIWQIDSFGTSVQHYFNIILFQCYGIGLIHFTCKFLQGLLDFNYRSSLCLFYTSLFSKLYSIPLHYSFALCHTRIQHSSSTVN